MPTWETYKVGKTRGGKAVYGITEGDIASTIVSDETAEGTFYITVAGFYNSSQQLLVNDQATPHPFFPGMGGLAFKNDPYTGIGRQKGSLNSGREFFIRVGALKLASFRLRDVGTRPEIRFHMEDSVFSDLDDPFFSNSFKDIVFSHEGKITTPASFYSIPYGEPVYDIEAGSNIAVTELDTPHRFKIDYIGDEFYGLTVAETDDTPAFKNINILKFNSNEFYIQQETGNTDTAKINLRSRLTKINDSGGTVNVQASIQAHAADATLDIGTRTNRFDEIFCTRIIAIQGGTAAVRAGGIAGGNVLGVASQGPTGNAELTVGTVTGRGNLVVGSARHSTGTRCLARVQSSGTGSFASGYALALNNVIAYNRTSILRSTGAGSTAHGNAYTYGYGYALIEATNNGAFAVGHAYGRGIGSYTARIAATGDGSFAGGRADAYVGNATILASGAGSFAWGGAYAATISATATGAVQFGVGTNSTAQSVQVGNAAVRLLSTGEINFNGPLNHDGTTAGFFGKTPATQRPDCFYLSVPFTATTDAALTQISGTGDDADINNNFAELAAKVNRIRDALRKLGLMAGG